MTTTDRVDAILDANKIQLFDENQALREELAAVRDLAYRGTSGDGDRDALEAIHARACRALNEEN